MRVGQVAALFVRKDTVYRVIPGVDCWDIERDARKWPGGSPVVAHPPCRAWGQLRHFARPRDDEKELAVWAVGQVRKFGGVLEHPGSSALWPVVGLPEPGEVDSFGGWTLPVDQWWFGHRAKKATRLYIVGCGRLGIPAVPLVLGEASHVIETRIRGARRRPSVTKAEREKTPEGMARWLVELALGCVV